LNAFDAILGWFKRGTIVIQTLAEPKHTDNGYPTSDGRPMAETDLHRDLMLDLIETLKAWFENDPMTYVSGNILLFYEKGNKRRHVSPDVLVVRGIPKHRRDNYLVWEEGKVPDFMIEVTSKMTRREDKEFKRTVYQKTLRVPEYFLFDPRAEYLKPPFHGYVVAPGPIRRNQACRWAIAERDAWAAPGEGGQSATPLGPGNRATSANTSGGQANCRTSVPGRGGRAKGSRRGE
jgi:Uma2 family endonuclease